MSTNKTQQSEAFWKQIGYMIDHPGSFGEVTSYFKKIEADRTNLLEAAEEALEELYRVSPSRASPKLRAAIAKAKGE